MPERFPRFKARRPKARRAGAKKQDWRLPAHERGYDHDWHVLRDRYLAKRPWCRFCEQRGLMAVLAGMVDHIVPLPDGPRLDVANLQSLCKNCHDTVKRRLEAAARRRGDLTLLIGWCADIQSAPTY